MIVLPPHAACLPDLLAIFPQPTAQRFLLLLVSAILTRGRHTIAHLLRTLRPRTSGHRTSSQRVLSSARWSGLQLACTLSRFLLRHFLPQDPLLLVGDDTVESHPGKHVYGKARHRDPVRSSPSYTAWRYGHRWVVLALLVRFPGTSRPWALPLLIDLDRSPEQNQQRHRPHRTPPQLMCRLIRLLLGWFPERSFVFVGDANYGTHERARFCHRHRSRLVLISQLHPQANLFQPPPVYQGQGRPRVKGQALPKPAPAVEQIAKRTRLTVSWYGGGHRQVDTLCRTGQWYKSGHGLVPIRWVYVQDRSGTHREESFFTTQTTFSAQTILEGYTARWNIETTFQECRAHLGLGTTPGWSKWTVLRAAPCLLGLYSVVALWSQQVPPEERRGDLFWGGKEAWTFSDALDSVRRWWWREWVFRQAIFSPSIEKLPWFWREFLLDRLAQTG
jgi:hypothetical protein